MKFITTIIVVLIYLIQSNYAIKIVEPKQNATAIDLYQNAFLIDIPDLTNFEICDDVFMFCYQTDKTNSSSYYTISRINFRNNNQPENIIIDQDLTVFTDLQFIIANLTGSEIYQFHSIFYNNLNQMNSLIGLSIKKQAFEIPTAAILSPNLKYLQYDGLSVALPKNFFQSNTLNTLEILDTSVGFTLPTLTQANQMLEFIRIEINEYYSTIPTSFNQYLSALKQLTLEVYNDGETFAFPTLEFTNLKQLYINFYNNGDDYSTFNFPQFNKMKNLEYIEINSEGFVIDPSLGYIDLSQINQDLKLNFYDISFAYVSKSNGFRLPAKTQLVFDYCDIDFNIIDFSQIASFSSFENQLEQTLPIINNPNDFNSFKIQFSKVYGDVPEGYCFIKNLNIDYNNLNGSLPQCFRCLGGSGSNSGMILPNDFLSFNPSSPVFCPDFEFKQDNQLVDTNGNGMVTISGKNIGWGFSTSLEYKVISANTKLGLILPKGVGTDSKQGSFTFNNGVNFNFNYSYIAPKIQSYSVVGINNVEYLSLNGIGFDYINDVNNVIINGDSLLFGQASTGSIIFTGMKFADLILEKGSSLEISMIVGGQTSNTVVFYIFPDLSLIDSNIQFKETGGSVTIKGSFGTTDTTLVSVNVNDEVQCIVNSIVITSLNITCPSYKPGNYPLHISVGGYLLSSNVIYIASPTPTPTATVNPTTSSDDGDNDDEPSNSSYLSFSFYLLCFIILLQQLF